MPRKQSPTTLKKKQIKEPNTLPERSVPAEIAMQLCAGGVLAFSAAALGMSFVVLAFNDTGSAFNGPASFVLLLFSINLATQGILAFRESNRVDRYRERIAACIFITLPLLLYVIYISFVNLSRYFLTVTQRVELYDSINLTAGIYGALVLSLVGSIWFWILLRDKNKLVWILQSTTKNAKKDTVLMQRLDRNKRLGYILLLAPIALFIFRILISVPIGLMGNGGTIFFPLLFLVNWALELLWLPSIIVGIILLRKQS